MAAGAVRVCIIPPSLKGPKYARKFPECGGRPPGELGATAVNEGSPNWVQPVKSPVSKPLLTTMQAGGVPVGVGVAVGVGVGVGVGVTEGLAVGVGVGVASGSTGACITTGIGAPVLKKPTVALVVCGAWLESNLKLYKVPQRIAFAF